MPYGIKIANAIFQRAIIVLNRLRNADNMTINKKCVNNSSKILSLGYTVLKEGISPDQAWIEKIQKYLYLQIKKKKWNLFWDWWISTGDMYQNIGIWLSRLLI